MQTLKNIKQKAVVGLLTLILSLITPAFALASSATAVSSPYLYTFNSSGTLVEGGSESDSTSGYWWVNSGARMTISDGHGKTVEGSLSATDPWRALYNVANPVDTDNGAHPQNIFRLQTRSKWGNASQEVYFDIKKYNLSNSDQRYESNGVLLFNRIEDTQNLYYTGFRVDGSAVIKKKIAGKYYTMKQVNGIYPGTYNRTTNPNLLPLNKWIGVKSVVTNQANGTVKIDLYSDKGWTGNWTLAASVVDDGKSYGGRAFTNPGYGGIRTDFMDVEFDNFSMKNI
jgi:hypothetical protein